MNKEFFEAFNAAFAGSCLTEPTKSVIGQIAFKGFDDFWTEECSGKEDEAWAASAQAVLAHAASILRKMGELEPTYDRQGCFERAAKALEELE